jgi:hypothetical protein
MTRLLIRSDDVSRQSDEHSQPLRCSFAQPAPQTPERVAAIRACAARLADRGLQAMWPAELPLSRRARARPEAVSGHQSARCAPASRLCAQCRLRAGQPMAGQFSPTARGPQRDMRHQHGTSAPTRGARIDGPRLDRFRSGSSGRHCRRYDRLIPRRRRSAIGWRGAQ